MNDRRLSKGKLTAPEDVGGYLTKPQLWDEPAPEPGTPTPLLPPAGEPTRKVDTSALARALAEAEETRASTLPIPAHPPSPQASASALEPNPLLGPTGTLRLRSNDSRAPWSRRARILAAVAVVIVIGGIAALAQLAGWLP